MIDIRHIGMVLMDGGIGTTAAVIHNIVLALIAYPECQKKAHEEIDRVVGSARICQLWLTMMTCHISKLSLKRYIHPFLKFLHCKAE